MFCMAQIPETEYLNGDIAKLYHHYFLGLSKLKTIEIG